MSTDNIEKTFFGFWPADDNYSSIDRLLLDINNHADKATQNSLRDTLIESENDKWHIIVSIDYMCLLHLKYLEEPLNNEREHNRTCDIHMLSFNTMRQIKNQYIEALNALNFLIFSSCFTGRGNYFLNDFSEVTLWHCIRIMYSSNNTPLRRIQFGRATKKELSRTGLCIEEKIDGFFNIEPNIFKDTFHYWDIIFEQGLIPLSAVGTKIISEHRLESYNLSVVLVWFEIENWIMEFTRVLGIPTSNQNRRGEIFYFGIKDIIDIFPTGTTISNLALELHEVREIRNNIVHNGTIPSHFESTKAIKLFIKMFNIRSGLNLSIDLHITQSNWM